MVAVTDTNLDNVNKNDEGEDNRGVTFVLSEKNTVHELVPEVADDESYHSLVITEQTKGAYNDKYTYTTGQSTIVVYTKSAESEVEDLIKDMF